MGLFDKIGRIMSFSNAAEADDADFNSDNEYYTDEYEETEDEQDAYEPAPSRMSTVRVTDRGNKVVNVHYDTDDVKLVIIRPRKVDEAANIAVHIRERRTVVLVLEHTDKNVSRRIMDFLMGAAYVIDGDFKKVSTNTFLITPRSVTVIGAEPFEAGDTAAGMYCESR